MYWVLQNNIFNEAGFIRLLEVLERFSLPYSQHRVVPFVGLLDPEPQIPEGANAIVMGSYSMAKYAHSKRWTPGSFDSPNLDFEVQLPHWGANLLNGDALVCLFADVPFQKHPFFIRPTLDSKSFAGFVTDEGDFREWQTRVLRLGANLGGTLSGETLVQVAAVKPIHQEFRLWVVDGRVVTASLYKEGHRIRYEETNEPALLEYAYKMLALWTPCRAFAMDIAMTPNGYSILETNCINAAGFYAADMQKLVMALEDMRFEDHLP